MFFQYQSPSLNQYIYLFLSMWVWCTTVGTLNQPPITEVLLVGGEVSSSYLHCTALICTLNKLTWASYSVCLNTKETRVKLDEFKKSEPG